MLSIEERGNVYKQQLTGIQGRLASFGNCIGWEVLNRGRKPNAGIFGKVGVLDSSIQVTAVEESWERLPDKIEAGMEFTLWCGVYSKPGMIRTATILRHALFETLEDELESFLGEAKILLDEVEKSNG